MSSLDYQKDQLGWGWNHPSETRIKYYYLARLIMLLMKTMGLEPYQQVVSIDKENNLVITLN